ncbi:MAG: SHOCT domain-containing protein [Chloroflexota bacterium]
MVIVIVAGALLVLLVGGFIAFALFVSRSFRQTGQASSSSALEVAKMRYAKGEISRAEFEQIREDLS